MQRNQKGFTLIELVIVIVILGILSAFALPRFADLSSDAELATTEGARGSVQAASAIVRSAALARGEDDEGTVSLEGQEVSLTGGYAEASDIGVASQLSDDFGVGVENGVATIALEGSDCSFTYSQVGAVENSGADDTTPNEAPIISEVDCTE